MNIATLGRISNINSLRIFVRHKNTAPSIKRITITTKSTEHHIDFKVNSVTRWLNDGHDVNVLIEGDPGKGAAVDNLFKRIESRVKAKARILQKIQSGDCLRFTLNPHKSKESDELANESTKPTSKKDTKEDLLESTEPKDILSDEFIERLNQSIRDMKKKS